MRVRLLPSSGVHWSGNASLTKTSHCLAAPKRVVRIKACPRHLAALRGVPSESTAQGTRAVSQGRRRSILLEIVVLALSLLSLMLSTAVAADPPVTGVANSTAYDSIEEAVIAAFEPLVQPFAKEEVGGAIIERDGQFYFTQAVSIGVRSRLDLAVELRKGDTLVALYHTHPLQVSTNALSLKLLEQFSADDMRIARELNVRSYIAEEAGRTLRVFDPEAKYVAGQGGQGEVVGELGLLYPQRMAVR